jgi:hypothetical protein
VLPPIDALAPPAVLELPAAALGAGQVEGSPAMAVTQTGG